MGPHNGLPDHPSTVKWNLPTLETDRLVLKPVELSDAKDVFEYAKLAIVPKFATWEPHQSVKESETFIQNFILPNYLAGNLTYGIRLKDSPDRMIGEVSAVFVSRPNKVMELGAVLHPDHWGKGIIVEALKKLIEECFRTRDVVRIQSRCFKENQQSFRMMEKLGMRHEGLLEKSLFCKGKSWDMEMFSLTK